MGKTWQERKTVNLTTRKLPQQSIEKGHHVDENALPEANGVSSEQWLVRMCPLSCCSAIYIANTDSKVSHKPS